MDSVLKYHDYYQEWQQTQLLNTIFCEKWQEDIFLNLLHNS